ncbi:hypothetical protein K438DRAFT_1818672 [Mycena galopus ATCC 62051]|nr:hypothetical protein K438DRAFT_1818672 [Mycena galopus ATCC 62051]
MSKPFLESNSEVLQVITDAPTTNSMIRAYDHLITFEDEVEFMWKSRIHTTNVIYNRYFTLIALLYASDAATATIVMLSPYKCIRYFNTEAVSSTLILATVDFILVLRVWLLYEKARWLLYALVPMIGFSILFHTRLELEPISRALVSHYTIYTTKGCYPLGLVPRYFTFYSLPVLVVSMTMFVLTVYKCGKTLLNHGRAQMPIYNLFLRDGVFWFVAIFSQFLPNQIITHRLVLILPSVTSIIGSRVLLNIHRLKPPKTLPTTTTDTTLAMGTTIELDTIGYPSRIPWGTVGTTTDGVILTAPNHDEITTVDVP